MRRLATLALIAACGRSAHAPPPAPSNTPAPTVVEPEPVALPAPSLGDDRPAPEEPPPPPSPPYLVGAWASACMPGATKGTSTQLTATITDTAWVLAVDAFRDPACRKHAAQLRTEGGYELVAPSSVVAGAWDARVDFAQRTLTVDDAATAKAMAKTCRLGARPRPKQPVDVLARGCPGLRVHPVATCAADHDVVALVGGALQLGVRPPDNDLCMAARRPTALAPTAALALALALPPQGAPQCDAYYRRTVDFAACPALPLDTKRAMAEARAAMMAAAAGMTPAQRVQMEPACQSATDALTSALASIGC